MAALTANPDLVLSFFLRMVRSLFDTVPKQKAWLLALGQNALIGDSTAVNDVVSNLQDWGASGVSNEGSSTQWLRSMETAAIAALCESALQRIEADGDTAGSAPNGVTHPWFGAQPSRLG